MMDKSRHFEKSVPEDYVLVKHLNARNDKRQMVVYTLLSFPPFLIIVPVLIFVALYVNGYNILENLNIRFYISLLITFAAFIVYIVLHEITHGITYKIFTGAKLTFGMNLAVAFCGVPDIYVRKKASLISLLMPFLIFSAVFIGLTVGMWFISPLYGILAGALFSLHLGGCVGDLHWTLIYAAKFRRCDTLMRDTGPEQWLYIPKAEAEKYGIEYISENDSVNNGN